MDKEYKLLPCPFCGGQEFEITSKWNYEENTKKNGGACVSVYCWTCNASKTSFSWGGTPYEETRADAIRAWNTRKGADNA